MGKQFYSLPVSWCVLECPFTASWNRCCLMPWAPSTANYMGCEKLGGRVCGEVEDIGGGHQVQNNDFQIMSQSCQQHESYTASLPHEVPQKGLFIFSQWLFSIVLLWLGGGEGEGETPCSTQLTMEHGVLAEGTSQYILGLFVITVSGYDSECALADDRLPPFPSLPPPLEMSRQPVLCAFPWLASGTAAVLWYVHSSRPTGLTGLWQWFLPYMAIRALGLSAGQDNFLPLLWLAAWVAQRMVGSGNMWWREATESSAKNA